MRIAFIHSYYASNEPSGENIAVGLQARALEAAGHDIEVVAVATDELAARPGYRWRTALGVATRRGVDPTDALARFRPEVVHLHNLFPNFGTSWLAGHRGPLVATAHNFRYLCASGMLARDGADCTECAGRAIPFPAVRHRCYRGSAAASLPVAASLVGGPARHPVLSTVDRLVVLAPRARSAFAAAGVPAEKLRVIPNFVEAPEEVAAAAEPTAGWIYVGRLSEQKGIVPLLHDWPAEVPLDIYGDGELRDEVTRLARGPIAYRGRVSREELMAILPGRTGLVFSSRSAEGLPTVYLEALAHGVPVVARRGNSAADDVSDAGTGAVYITGEELRAALAQVTRDWRDLNRRALGRFAAAYSPASWVRSVTTLYADVIRAA